MMKITHGGIDFRCWRERWIDGEGGRQGTAGNDEVCKSGGGHSGGDLVEGEA